MKGEFYCIGALDERGEVFAVIDEAGSLYVSCVETIAEHSQKYLTRHEAVQAQKRLERYLDIVYASKIGAKPNSTILKITMEVTPDGK